MGGSSGSVGGGWTSPSEMAKKVRDEEKRVVGDRFQTELSDLLGNLLSRLNDRKTQITKDRLDDIVGLLQGVLAESIQQMFGGSVSKHTYVDGMSDIDCLLIVDRTDLERNGPSSTIQDVATALKDQLGNVAEVSTGRMAITVTYSDGMEIQLLPAAREGDKLRIPSSREENKWSSVDPKKFNEGLTKYNAECNGKLVPTIKLAKAIIGQLPGEKTLSGYHMESLAIEAFKNYSGVKTTAAMLPHFFEHAKNRVLQPIADKSGQSRHVDDYLGQQNSVDRNNASHILGRISKRLASASAAGSLDQWKDILGVDE